MFISWLITQLTNQQTKGGNLLKLILNSDEPIFLQIARAIEDEILEVDIEEEMQIPSTTELSKLYQINPATVLKGINLLVDREILYKKRGIGMFVKEGATAIIKQDRKEKFKVQVVGGLIKESKKLGMSKIELIDMIELCMEEE